MQYFHILTRYENIYKTEGKTTLRVVGRLNGSPVTNYPQHRMRREKVQGYTVYRRGGGEVYTQTEGRFSVPLHTGGLTLRSEMRGPFLWRRSRVTFHLSPSCPRAGRGSDTFLEKEQKLCICAGPKAQIERQAHETISSFH